MSDFHYHILTLICFAYITVRVILGMVRLTNCSTTDDRIDSVSAQVNALYNRFNALENYLKVKYRSEYMFCEYVKKEKE